MEKHDSHNSHDSHAPSYGIYILVWLGLMTLTVVTVAVAGIDFGPLTIATALLVASVKTYLVLTIFMHLNFEQKVFRIFLVVAMFFLIISIVLLFADYLFM